MRYAVGDKVLVSRAENGEDHEQAEVVDSYELIIGEDRRPMVVVQFEDGERKYMTAATPNVLPSDEPDEDEAAGGPPTGEAEHAELDDEALGADAPGDQADREDDLAFAEEEEGASP
jgi:hypothetical protein